jgi:hypothetical protein
MEITALKQHFITLGGLELGVDLKTEQSTEPLVMALEQYIGREIDKSLILVLKEYEGYLFKSDDTIGVEVDVDIPILGESNFLEFGMFLTLNESPYKIEAHIKSNEDLFGKEFFPFAEATPGDYIAYNMIDNKVYFISHDFNENEKFRFKISENLKSYFMSLKEENKKEESKPVQKEEPKLLKVTYNPDFLKKAKEEAEKMKEDKK